MISSTPHFHLQQCKQRLLLSAWEKGAGHPQDPCSAPCCRLWAPEALRAPQAAAGVYVTRRRFLPDAGLPSHLICFCSATESSPTMRFYKLHLFLQAIGFTRIASSLRNPDNLLLLLLAALNTLSVLPLKQSH